MQKRKSEKRCNSLDKQLWTNAGMSVGIENTVLNPMVYFKSESYGFMETVLCSPNRHKRCKRRGCCEYMEPKTDEECSEQTNVPIEKWKAMSGREKKERLASAPLLAKRGYRLCRKVKLTIEEVPIEPTEEDE